MSNDSIDINKFIQLIRTTRPQDRFLMSVNQIDKNSVKNALNQLEKHLSNNDGYLLLIRK